MPFTCDIRNYDRILYLGDSKTGGQSSPLTVKWFYLLHQWMKAQAAAKGSRFDAITSGINGATMASLNAILSTAAYAWDPTAIIINMGTNDDSSLVVNATYATQCATFLSGLQTAANYNKKKAPRWMIWVGTNYLGEKWPDGSNPFDTVANGINDHSAIRQTACTNAGILYWNPRPAILAYEPLFNLANAGSGILSDINDGATGKHEIVVGAAALRDWMTLGAYQGINAQLPQFPVFSFT